MSGFHCYLSDLSFCVLLIVFVLFVLSSRCLFGGAISNITHSLWNYYIGGNNYIKNKVMIVFSALLVGQSFM